MSREKINDGLTKYQRHYRKNKEKRNSYSKEYHLKNRDSILNRKVLYDKLTRECSSHKPIVYLIVKENYVGTTENLKCRLRSHKKDFGRDVSEVLVLKEFVERKDALEYERELHNQGYNGKHRFNTYK